MIYKLSSWREEMAKWLKTEAVAHDGAVWSWVNPEHPGYPYPEIAGYLLSFLAKEPNCQSLQLKVANRLFADLLQNGAVGRDGWLYLFDTGIALRGLLDYSNNHAFDAFQNEQLNKALSLFPSRIRNGQAVWSNIHQEPKERQWSREYGPHQLKLNFMLRAWHEKLHNPDAHLLISKLIEDIIPRFEEGRFRTFFDSSECNLHAHCYALEGLWACQGLDISIQNLLSHLKSGADWLVSIQNNKGGLPEWHNGIEGWGRYRADVTAQATRLWSLLDKSKYQVPIERALRFLMDLRDPSGGIKFVTESKDVNTWSTIFATQSLDILLGKKINLV